MSTGIRTILAFLFALIIILLYNMYISKKTPPEPEKKVAPQAKVEEVVQMPVGSETALKPLEEEEIVVETQLYRVVLSSLGGTIKSFQLKQYGGLGGGWIEVLKGLEEWTKNELANASQNQMEVWRKRKNTLDSLTEWMKKGYMILPKGEMDKWIKSADAYIEVVKRSYTGLGAECDKFLAKIAEFPKWLQEDYTECVELIPYGEKTLALSLPGNLSLENLPCRIERETTSEGEVVSFNYEFPSGKKLTKAFIFRPEDYEFDLRISGDTRIYSLNWNSGLAITEGNSNDDVNSFSSVALMGGQFLKESLRGLTKKKKLALSGSVEWVGVRTKYFLACIFPANPVKTEGFEAYLLSRTVDWPKEENEAGFGCVPSRGGKYTGNTRITVSLISPEEKNFHIYVGPIDYEELKKLDAGTERIVDFGWSWIAPLSKLLFRFLKFLRSFIPNYGVVIIIFSVIMKLLFYPLTHRGTRSMRAMAKLQPEMKRIQQQYKNDPKRLNREIMELYRKHKVNPLGGCLPLLIQMPIFIALYSILRTTIELRRAQFIPFWIRDLSVQDPYYVLPLLMGGFMLLQSLLTPTDPRQRWTTFFMPVVITVIFLNFPAGLVLYWLVNNILSVAEHFILAKKEVSTATT